MNCETPLKDGFYAAWPICIGYVPIGIALGVLGQKAGLSSMEIGLMSLIVFAGSAQFISISMIATGASAFAIILTVFTVNLRHLLMSSALAPYFMGERWHRLFLFAYGITDESFSVNMVHLNSEQWDITRAIYTNQIANAVWILSTMIGGYFGAFIPSDKFGIDYALPAMFIALLSFQLNSRKYIWAGIASAGLATVLSMYMEGTLYVVIASMSVSTIATIFVYYNKKQKELL